MLTIDEVEEIINRTVTACLRLDADARLEARECANRQQGVIRQAAQDIVNGVRPTWPGEHL